MPRRFVICLRHVPSRSFLRTGTTVVLGTLLNALIGIAALRVYTHLAPAQVFGGANLILGILGLGFQLFVQPVVSTQLRYHTEARRAGHGDSFTVQTLGWALVAAALAAGLALIGLTLWSGGGNSDLSIGISVAAVFWILVNASRGVFFARFHAEQRMTPFVWLRVLEACLIALMTGVLLVLAASQEAFVWGQVLGLAGGLVVASLFAPWPMFGAFAHLADREHAVPGFRAKLWRYGAPFAPMAVLGWLANLGDRYVLAALLGGAATGQYLAAFSIAKSGIFAGAGRAERSLPPETLRCRNLRRPQSC